MCRHRTVDTEHSDLTGTAMLFYLQMRQRRCREKASSKFKELPRVTQPLLRPQ